jgi:hypothetical protein
LWWRDPRAAQRRYLPHVADQAKGIWAPMNADNTNLLCLSDRRSSAAKFVSMHGIVVPIPTLPLWSIRILSVREATPLAVT